MNPVKYYPFAPAKSFGNWVDDFFNRSIGDIIGSDFMAGQPSVNVIEENNLLRLELAAPGLLKDDFSFWFRLANKETTSCCVQQM